MRRVPRRVAVVAGLVAAGSFLMAGPGTGCLPFLAEVTLETADFCFIFDCQNGLFGGTVDPCPDATNDNSDMESVTSPPIGPLFVDCPNAGRP